MSDALTRTLSEPLAEVADAGFTDGVMFAVLNKRRKRAGVEMGAGAMVTALVCGALPFTAFGQTVNDAALQLAGEMSLPLATSLAVLALAALATQLLAD